VAAAIVYDGLMIIVFAIEARPLPVLDPTSWSGERMNALSCSHFVGNALHCAPAKHHR
jgi:hypothetical protein